MGPRPAESAVQPLVAVLVVLRDRGARRVAAEGLVAMSGSMSGKTERSTEGDVARATGSHHRETSRPSDLCQRTQQSEPTDRGIGAAFPC